MKIGIDIGGMSIKFGLVDEENQITAKTVIPTELDIPYQKLVGKMADAVKQLLEEQHLTLEDCDGIGIGCPGTINDETGVVIYSNNIRWENIPLVEELGKHLPVHIAIANDADAAALGGSMCRRSKRGKGSSPAHTRNRCWQWGDLRQKDFPRISCRRLRARSYFD